MEDRAILLVEDNPDDALLTRRALRKSGIQNRVVVARDGAEALDILFGGDELPRFVLLDLKLPKIDGMEVLGRIRADRRTKDLPVVIMVSPNGERPAGEDRVRSADFCIDKAVDYDVFLRAIRRLRVLLAARREPAWRAGRAGADVRTA